MRFYKMGIDKPFFSFYLCSKFERLTTKNLILLTIMREKITTILAQAADKLGYQLCSADEVVEAVGRGNFPMAIVGPVEAAGPMAGEVRTAVYDITINLLKIKECRADEQEPYYSMLDADARALAELVECSAEVVSVAIKSLRPQPKAHTHLRDIGLEAKLRVVLFDAPNNQVK